ncbi:MAG: hypothetical protein AAF355_08025 [Myxococcota bacterium]
MQPFAEKFAELVSMVRNPEGCPQFDKVSLVDGRAIDGNVIPQAALQTEAQFTERFADVYSRALPWLSLHALGFVEGALLVVLKSPKDTTANRDAEVTTIHLQGPSEYVRSSRGWELADGIHTQEIRLDTQHLSEPSATTR